MKCTAHLACLTVLFQCHRDKPCTATLTRLVLHRLCWVENVINSGSKPHGHCCDLWASPLWQEVAVDRSQVEAMLDNTWTPAHKQSPRKERELCLFGTAVTAECSLADATVWTTPTLWAHEIFQNYLLHLHQSKTNSEFPLSSIPSPVYVYALHFQSHQHNADRTASCCWDNPGWT